MNKDLRHIIKDNEQAAAGALSRGDYVQAFLLVHALIESLLRIFLEVDRKKDGFRDLINEYEAYLSSEDYPVPEFVDDLKRFNSRRNRMVHDLWKIGYSVTNRQTKWQAHYAVHIFYGLFIEWLDTFDETITDSGFQYLKPEDPMTPEELARLEESVRIVVPHLFRKEEPEGG